MGKLLTRDDILNAQDLPTERVAVPEWSGEVIVRGLTAAERDAFEQSIVETRGKNTRMNLKNIRAKLVAMTVVDEQGNRIFSDEDAELLGKKSAAALDRIFSVAQRLSGLRPEDVEELVGN
ncbi:MAG TPA: hypothetical protein PK184_20370 [Phycisphaerae bacterium]|mgnify:CR=1 FL=1|nr:hypothetical protein [Phycisphaerae bacterium]